MCATRVPSGRIAGLGTDLTGVRSARAHGAAPIANANTEEKIQRFDPALPAFMFVSEQ
jgi:hypothetical protein